MNRWRLPNDRALLTPFASSSTLLAFDFDGTLAPIVEEPDDARMRPTTAALLERLARLCPCAVISGRGLHDLLPRLDGVDLAYAVGNHGAEWGEGDEPHIVELRKLIASLRERLQGALGHRTGFRIEDKGLSLAVHLRGEALEGGAAAVLKALEPRGRVRVFGGHRVVNIVLADAPHKGTALSRIVEALGSQAALYVGDDTTDEDAFVNPGIQHFLSLRVGASGESRAAHYLESQEEIDELLEALVRLRGGQVENRPNGA